MPIPPLAYYVVPRVEGFKIHLLVIGSKTRHIDEECECPDVVVFSDQIHVELLSAFVYRGVDKARPDTARYDASSDGVVM